MMATEKVYNRNYKRILFTFAFLQLIAWLFDIVENYHLLKWLKHPVIGREFGFYHFAVYSKWIIALTAALIALITLVVSSLKRKILKQ